MLLAREFMRLTVLEALRPSALLGTTNPAWPTMAGEFVADSRVDPMDDIGDDERRPCCSVYTEDTALTKIAQSGSQMYSGLVDLVFEISIVQKFKVDGGEPVVDFCDTDAANEAALGSLEDQIFHALHVGPSGALFRQMVKLPFAEWHSAIKRSGEENARLATRTVRARIAIKETCYNVNPRVEAIGLDRLPSALKAIAEQLGESTYLHELAFGMAQLSPQMPVRPLLESVGVELHRAGPDNALAAGEANNLQE